MAQPHTRRKKTPGNPRISSSGALLHWLGMLAMVVGLFAPLATAEAAVTPMTPSQAMMKAAQEPFSTDTADFQRVVLVGDFQQQVGCGDWDTNCDQTRLQNINGFWTGVFGVPAGAYNWELVAVDWNGAQFSIAEGQVNIAEGQTGIYAEFNSATRENNVWATTGIAYANGVFGDVALAQEGDGYVATALNISTPGRVDMQVTVNGAPVQTGAEFQQGVSRVTFDATGNITNVEHRGFAEVTVQRMDADGNPLTGSCFVLDGSSQTRGCDADGSPDGSADGTTTLRFPSGFQPGSYTLRETRAAEGAESLADQQIDVQPGQSTIEARSEGEPTPETGDLVVLRQDTAGTAVGGACFEITNANGEVVSSACDESGDVADDGRIGLLGVPSGDYTLSETRTPDGFEPAADMQVSVPANDVLNQPVQSAAIAPEEPIETEEPTEEVTEPPTEVATEEPTEEVTEPPTEVATEEPTAVGRIVVYREDNVGNPVGGSCFEVIDSNGQVVADNCDEDGIAADDGSTGIVDVPVGDYIMSESRVPEGFEPAPDTPVTVTEGDVIYTVSSAPIPATEPPTEEATEEVTEVPIETEPPTEEATEEVTEVPIETEPPTEVATEEPTEEATEPPTAEATEEPTAVGRIVVYREDDAGNPVGGSCFEVINSGGEVIGANCDEDGIAPNDGSIGVVEVPVGDHTMVESRVPEGYEQAPDTPVTVTEGDVIYTVSSAQSQATEEPTEEATEEPTEEATEEPTEEVAPPADGAGLQVTYDHDDSQPKACVELESRASIGMMEIPYACDDGENDADPAPGSIRIQSLPPGDFDLVVYEGPSELVAAEPQPVSLQEGRIEPLSLESEEPQTTSFTVQTNDANGVGIAGVTFELDTGATASSDDSGLAAFAGVTPGDYTVTMTGVPDGFNLSDPASQSITVAADGSSTVTFQISRATTSFTVQTNDANGVGVAGVTFELDTGATASSDDSGLATFADVTPGDYTVTMTGVPDGFNLSDPASQPITVAADGSSTVTFQINRATTSFTVQVTDGEVGVGGVSFLLDDAGEPVVSDDSGLATFNNVTPGEHTVTMTGVPDGFNLSDPASQPITVAADGSSTVTFQINRATTSFTVQTTDANGVGVAGVTYELDNGATAQSDESGTTTFNGVVPGDYTVTMTGVPDGFNLADPAAQPISVAGDGSTTASFQISRATTSFTVQTNDANGVGVAGVTFELDNGATASSDDSGLATFTDVVPGDYTVTMTGVPDGFNLADPAAQPITVAADGSSSVTFQISRATTSFTVQTTDANGVGVAGVTFELDTGATASSDDSGLATFADVTPGDYTVTMTGVPDGFNLADPAAQPITVAGDGSSSVTFQISRATTSFTVQTNDANGVGVAGVTFELDNGAVAESDENGTATFTEVVPGDYTVTMTGVPDGFNPADPAAQPVSIAGDGSTTVSFQITEVTVDIVVNTVNETTGESVAGACYALDGSEITCDEEATGQVVFQNESPGERSLTMETVPEGFEPAADQVIPAGTTNVDVGVQQATGNIIVSVVDGDGEPVDGACVQVGDSTPACDPGDDNVFTYSGIAATQQTVTLTQIPDGYEPLPEGDEIQTIEVIANQDNPVTFTLTEAPPATGNVVVSVVDGESAPVTGACVQLNTGEPVCDDDDDNDGVYTFTAPEGSHSVTISNIPDGFEPLPEGEEVQTIEVIANQDNPVTFTLTETPPTTGNLNVSVLFSGEEETPVPNACLIATMEEGGITEEACDEDGDGIVNFEGIQVGTYLIDLDSERYDGPPIEPVTPVSGTASADEPGTATLYLTQQPTTGTLQITVTDGETNVPGACFLVGDQTVCDDQDGDTDATPGVVTITGIEPNDNLAVSMSRLPAGFQQPADQDISVQAGQTTSIEFQLEAEILPGSVTVRTTNGNGDPLSNACYRLVQGSTIIGPLCDSEPADGEIVFENVPAGDYRLEQTTRPSNQFATPSPRTVSVAPEENTLVEIEMSQRPGSLRITTVDADDTSVVLEGACYRILGDPGFGPFCDAADGNSDGIVRFTNLPAGQYELEQTVSTAGFDPAANRTVTINPGGSTQITVVNERVQPPAESGTLVVIPLDPSGNPVQGGCFQVFDGDSPVTGRICDNADDQPASITFEGLPVGDLTLRALLAPSPDWQIAADINVTIANGETTTVEVPHEFKPGNVVIQAVNSVGLPLQGACFTLTDAGDTDLCTDSTGQSTVIGLTPGTRELTQTEAPFGFKLDETPREVVVRPGQTTTVRVVFENEPPPNTGTVQVQKFFCPAGEEGERTTFHGGAQGNQELQRTAGCEPGIAHFTLVAEDGSTESNAEFSTNAEGRAQLTAVEGIYLLTETDPDMPGNSSARLRVATGQMTTVIVINYVAPPAPAPVTINVEGYTCPPGFNGSSFVDFQNSCMAESQLTNQITVRAEAEARYKRSTGDTGVLGKTSFVDLPAGTYTIWAEQPHTVPVTYMFCGADVNSPNLKTVNGSVRVTLESGSTILCRVFQVPSLFDAEHGAIQVQKFNCPINERQRGYDFQNECGRATEPIPFEIQQVDPKTGDLVGDPVRVNTNSDGIVQFPMLLPGTYKLTEVDHEWCFAQSNSVDANGDVVVQKDKLSEVWVYNCVGTKAPPNTGSGDAAGLSGPDGGLSPMKVLPNLIWPTVLLAGWLIWRDRKQA